MDIDDQIHDIIVAGSGFTGAMAAQTLIENGARVLMLDAGIKPSDSLGNVPPENFLSIRKENAMQYKFWLGKNFEAITWQKTGPGAQLTPARKYVAENVHKLMPVISDTFNAIESLGFGGLGGAWGLGCNVYSDSELKQAGLAPAMKTAYQIISDRIGISGPAEDGLPYSLEGLKNIQPPGNIDKNSESIYQKYIKKRKILNDKGFYLDKPALAILTQNKEDRKPCSYDEMDFYSNRGLSAYRPVITIDSLKKAHGFKYVPGALILSYSEETEFTKVDYINTVTGERGSIKCKKLILCTGTLSTARIVLRSMGGQREVKLPLLSDPYKYFTMIQPSMLGVNLEEPRTALAQLMLFYDPDKTNSNVSSASIYSYRSLMLFRAVKELPLSYKDARILMQYLLPAVSIMGVHHPDNASQVKYIELVAAGDSISRDALKIAWSLSPEELKEIKKRNRKFSSAMSKLGCYTIKKTDPGAGSSAHYAGCLPFSAYKRDFHLHPTGKIYGTKSVYVADGSGFRFLPAKGITLTLMANAHLTAMNSLQNS